MPTSSLGSLMEGPPPPPPPPPPRGPDRGKRDEWSEGGVLSLLEVYESKWLLRNRAKLKGTDWEDIARQVTVCCAGTKALKTPIQCKNKIESMKKRYRSEPADSSWQFYTRMDGLLKGAGTPNCPARPKPETNIDLQEPPKPGANAELEPNSQDSNQDEEEWNTPPPPHIDVNANPENEEGKQSRATDSDVSAPRSKAGNARDRATRAENPSKRRRGLGSEVAESVRMLAHSILKIEEARMEMYKNSERTRVEAEIKRGEMELKRTEIIAKTQLQIAKLFVKRSSGTSSKSEGPLLRTELDMLPRREGLCCIFFLPL